MCSDRNLEWLFPPLVCYIFHPSQLFQFDCTDDIWRIVHPILYAPIRKLWAHYGLFTFFMPGSLSSLNCFGNVTCTHGCEDAVTCLLLPLSTESVNVYSTQYEMETCWCTISIPSCPVKISLIYYAKHSDRLTHTSQSAESRHIHLK